MQQCSAIPVPLAQQCCNSFFGGRALTLLFCFLHLWISEILLLLISWHCPLLLHPIAPVRSPESHQRPRVLLSLLYFLLELQISFRPLPKNTRATAVWASHLYNHSKGRLTVLILFTPICLQGSSIDVSIDFLYAIVAGILGPCLPCIKGDSQIKNIILMSLRRRWLIIYLSARISRPNMVYCAFHTHVVPLFPNIIPQYLALRYYPYINSRKYKDSS